MSFANTIKSSEPDNSFIWIEGYDDAVVGMCLDYNRLCYSIYQLILITMKDMEYPDYEEAAAYVFQYVIPDYKMDDPNVPFFIYDLTHG